MARAVSETTTYYEILGISQDASADEIKTRYKALVLKFHPDKEKSSIANDAMISINQAYEVLSDEKRRFAYDLALKISEEPCNETTHEKTPCNETPHPKRGVLPVVNLSKKSRVLVVVVLAVSFLAGYYGEAWQADPKSISDEYMHANSHYFVAIVHEPLFSLPLFVPGLGLAWGVLGSFVLGLQDHAVLVTPIHAKASGFFLPYLVSAASLKLYVCYIGMTRSLRLVISIRERRFSKFDSTFMQGEMVLSVILASVAGLVEHAMVHAR